jgi:hypothetical protein
MTSEGNLQKPLKLISKIALRPAPISARLDNLSVMIISVSKKSPNTRPERDSSVCNFDIHPYNTRN